MRGFDPGTSIYFAKVIWRRRAAADEGGHYSFATPL
jgi:hypothetical protein